MLNDFLTALITLIPTATLAGMSAYALTAAYFQTKKVTLMTEADYNELVEATAKKAEILGEEPDTELEEMTEREIRPEGEPVEPMTPEEFEELVEEPEAEEPTETVIPAHTAILAQARELYKEGSSMSIRALMKSGTKRPRGRSVLKAQWVEAYVAQRLGA